MSDENRNTDQESRRMAPLRELAEKRKENLLKSGKGKNSMNEGGLKPSGPMGTILNVDGHTVEGFIGSEIEYWASMLAGGALATFSVISMTKKTTVWNIAGSLIGGALVYRGLTGLVYNDEMSQSYLDGLANNAAVTQHLEGIKVEHSITVNRPASEIYQVWRNFSNLPKIMGHLESVTESNEIESHWVAKGPVGTRFEWDAEVYMEKVGELISWRSVEGAEVDNAGSVRFEPTSNGEGTKITVMLKYHPPMGPVGAAFAALFGEEPKQQISADLKKFKDAMEAGEFDTGSSTPQFATNGHSTNGHSSNGRA